MQLSEHFTLGEMTHSADHPDVANVPNQDQILAMEALCENVGEKIRAALGPVIVTSGFRSPELNKLVGSKAKYSQHMDGEAMDIHVPGVRNDDLWHFITGTEDLEFDQCIAENLSETNGKQGWVHVSFSRYKNRREAISFIGKGKYVPGLKYAS